jgi:prepilin-type N-terminal cleavage/methylation domain-containing protein
MTGLSAQGDLDRRRRGAEAGFTLIELAVATAVLLLAVLLACDLLDESGRVLHHSVRRARDPWTLLAAELLRNDLRGTDTPLYYPPPPEAPKPPSRGTWQSGAMLLRTADDQVIWQRLPDGRLGRRVVGGGMRIYLQDVRDFRWQRLRGNAIEVWVRYHVSSPYLRQLAGSLPRSDPGEDHDLHLLVVARGTGEAQSW